MNHRQKRSTRMTITPHTPNTLRRRIHKHTGRRRPFPTERMTSRAMMSLSTRQLQRSILLGYQLFTFFDLEGQHEELQTPELKQAITRITADYDFPNLPRNNPYPADWLLRPELIRAIKEFHKLFDKLPASSDLDPTPQPPPIQPRQTQDQTRSSPVTLHLSSLDLRRHEPTLHLKS